MILEDSHKKKTQPWTLKYHQHNIAAGSFKALSALHFI